jgi:hypothetical protein
MEDLAVSLRQRPRQAVSQGEPPKRMTRFYPAHSLRSWRLHPSRPVDVEPRLSQARGRRETFGGDGDCVLARGGGSTRARAHLALVARCVLATRHRHDSIPVIAASRVSGPSRQHNRPAWPMPAMCVANARLESEACEEHRGTRRDLNAHALNELAAWKYPSV